MSSEADLFRVQRVVQIDPCDESHRFIGEQVLAPCVDERIENQVGVADRNENDRSKDRSTAAEVILCEEWVGDTVNRSRRATARRDAERAQSRLAAPIGERWQQVRRTFLHPLGHGPTLDRARQISRRTAPDLGVELPCSNATSCRLTPTLLFNSRVSNTVPPGPPVAAKIMLRSPKRVELQPSRPRVPHRRS
jgi:hypothetical protein